MRDQFYGYLNPESTKTVSNSRLTNRWFYGYLNPESTKTRYAGHPILRGFTVT